MLPDCAGTWRAGVDAPILRGRRLAAIKHATRGTDIH